MNRNAIQLTDAGVYIFQAPAKIAAQINRELYIVYTAPSHKATGVIVYRPEQPIKSLYVMLESLYQKFVTELNARGSNIKVKLFGMANPNPSTIQGTRSWVLTKGMAITAEDTGRNVSRGLVIDCETGLVGVSYAEGVPTGTYAETETLLAGGGAADRVKLPEARRQVLAIMNNRVTRQLVSQCIDEYSHLDGNLPKKPSDAFMQKDLNSFGADLVLIFEDVGATKPVETWMKRVLTRVPQTRFVWVGKKIPASLKKIAKGIRRLPELEPQDLGVFKTALANEIDAIPTTMTPPAPVIDLLLPKKTRAKRRK